MNRESICTAIGGFLINFCIGIPFLYGNLSTYMVSSMHYSGFYDESDIGEDVWILGLFNGALFVPMLIVEHVVARLGYRIALLIGHIIFTSGYFLTYFSVQHSIWSTIFTFGLICGFGAGISIVTTIDIVSKWFPDKVATMTAVLLSGFSVGGMAFNQVVSLYVNPDNLIPEKELGSIRIFNQTEILDRVPSTFLLLGSVITVLQFLGVALSFTPRSVSYEEFMSEDDSSNKKDSSANNSPSLRSHTPSEVLKDPEAYVLWIVVFSTLVCLMGIQFAYKSFGQTFIYDDHFLATLGASAAVTSALYKIFIAYIADISSTKIVYIITNGVAVVFTFTLYCTRDQGRGRYFVWICVLYCLFSTTLVLTPSIVRIMYGAEHFSTNFAIIWSAASLSGIGCPLLIGNLLKVLGWNSMLNVLGAVAAVGFLFTFCLGIPYCPKRKVSPPNTEMQTQKSE